MLKFFRTTMFLVSLFLGFSGSQSALAALASSGTVYMYSDPGSWVGGGLGTQEVTWLHGIDGVFSSYGTNTNLAEVTFSNGDNWSFYFAAPSYDPITNTNMGTTPLKVGFYANATRWPFNSPTKPGLSVSGAGRGDNTLSGWFNVLDIGFDTDGSLLKLAVDFRQYDESANQSGPSLYGSLRYNSAIPVDPVPLPASVFLFLSGLLPIVALKKTRRMFSKVSPA